MLTFLLCHLALPICYSENKNLILVFLSHRYDFCHCFTDAPSDKGEDKQELSQDDTLHVASLKKEQSSLQAAEGRLYMPSASVEDGHVNKM